MPATRVHPPVASDIGTGEDCYCHEIREPVGDILIARRTAPALAPVALALALALSGCTFTANLTVSADEVANTAENALEAQVGSRPDIDCGADDVALVNGTVVDCVLTDPATSAEYDAVVTISEVDGTKYRVDVTVADSPRAGSQIEPSDDPVVDEPTGITHKVAADSVARLAANALFNQSPPYYEIDCGGGDLEVSLGAVFDCSATHPDGTVYDATISITDISETDYSINVVRGATPRG